MRFYALICAYLIGFAANAQVLGRIPLELVLTDDGKADYTFTEPVTDGRLDLGRHMIKLTNMSEGKFVLEFHDPFVVRLVSKSNSKPFTRIMREIQMAFYPLDFLSLTQIFESNPNSVISFDTFDAKAERYIEWYSSQNRSTNPPPFSRPKLYRVFGLHLTLKLRDFIRGGFINTHEANAVYREVIDTSGNTAPKVEIKPLAFWELRSLQEPLVHQILEIASGERVIDLSAPFPQNNDERGRVLDFKKSCLGPLNGNSKEKK